MVLCAALSAYAVNSVCFRWQNNGWDGGEMTKGDNGIYSLNIGTVGAGAEFKLVIDGSWKGTKDQSFKIDVPQGYDVIGDNGNPTLADAAKNVTVYFNPENNEFWYTGEIEKSTYYIVTSSGAWDFTNPIELEEGEDGLYTATLAKDVQYFFISQGRMTGWDTAGATRYYPAGASEDVAVDKDGSYSFETSGSKVWTKPASEITISINFSTKSFTADVPVQNISSTYYLLGHNVEGIVSWTPNSGLEGKYVENYKAKEGPFAENPFTGFIFSDVTLKEGNQFNFAPALSEDASDWSKSKPRIAPAGGADYTFEKTLSGNEYAETAVGFFTDNEKSFSAQPGKYLICLDAANKKLYLFNADNTTGVEDVVIDLNAPAEYYNLNGVKVENPATGIYIVRQGGKTFKAVIR